jgi:3-isopropylmalate/(R)-2-methylmalate dehydratase small subunit
VLECPGITAAVEDGDELEVNLDTGEIKNLTRGQVLQARPPEGFLKSMLECGGLIPFLQSPQGREFLNRAG